MRLWKNTHRRERRRLRGARWDMNRKHAFCSFLFLRKGLEFYSFQRRANGCGAPILNSRHEKPATISNTNEIPAAANAALSGSGAFAEDIEETRESREAPVVSRDPVASVAVSIRVCVFFFNCRVGFSAGVPSAIHIPFPFQNKRHRSVKDEAVFQRPDRFPPRLVVCAEQHHGSFRAG